MTPSNGKPKQNDYTRVEMLLYCHFAGLYILSLFFEQKYITDIYFLPYGICSTFAVVIENIQRKNLTETLTKRVDRQNC